MRIIGATSALLLLTLSPNAVPAQQPAPTTMIPAEAIQAATINAADLIGRATDVGQLTPATTPT